MQQLTLPGINNFHPRSKFDRVKTFSFEEGMYLIKNFKKAKLQGFKIEGLVDPQSPRIKMFRRGQTQCVKCGLRGNHFYAERHINDTKSPYSLNLYGVSDRGFEAMLTWDHILPKSLGGSSGELNSQCLCEKCNRDKGNSLSLGELISIAGHKDAVAMNGFPGFAGNMGATVDKTRWTTISSILKKVTEEFNTLSKAKI